MYLQLGQTMYTRVMCTEGSVRLSVPVPQLGQTVAVLQLGQTVCMCTAARSDCRRDMNPNCPDRRGGRGGVVGLVRAAAVARHLRLEVRPDRDPGVGDHPAGDGRLPPARLGVRRARLLAPEHVPAAAPLVQVSRGARARTCPQELRHKTQNTNTKWQIQIKIRQL